MYNYGTEKPNILTDEGQRQFLKVRDKVNSLLKQSGAVMLGWVGGSWEQMACIDRMVELGELEEIGAPASCGQARVFCRPNDRLHPRFR